MSECACARMRQEDEDLERASLGGQIRAANERFPKWFEHLHTALDIVRIIRRRIFG